MPVEPREFTAKQVAEMHKQYLAAQSGDVASRVARAHHTSQARMYALFHQHGHTQMRGQGRKPGPDSPAKPYSEPRRCPGWPLFCAFCPVTPRCDEWQCDNCPIWRKVCPCWFPKLRKSDWHIAFRQWQTARDKRQRQAAQMKARAGCQRDY